MRCRVMVPVGNTGRIEVCCYNMLNDRGECPVHGQQAIVQPSWMADDKWQEYLRKREIQLTNIQNRDKGIGTGKGTGTGG